MTILAVIKDVCAAVGVAIPASVIAPSTNKRTMEEMLALANEVAQSIAYDNREWSRLKRSIVYTGDGVTVGWNLPADYKRMLLTSEVWRSTDTQAPMRFIYDTNEWGRRGLSADYGSMGMWTLMNGQMLIQPPLGVGQTATFVYMHRNCVILASGGLGDNFISDLDSYALDERVLKLGIIWRWKQAKGSAYAEDMGTFADALNTSAGNDNPAPIFIGHAPLSSHARFAYPWQTP